MTNCPALDRFTAITRERALTPEETRELDRLLYNQRQRQWRLPMQIAKLREKLRKMEAQLEPNQVNTLLRIERKLRHRRADAIERELTQVSNREEPNV